MQDAELREAVDLLTAKYAWGLLPEGELVERVRRAIAEGATGSFERLARRQYQFALYEACRQSADVPRRKRAYADLFRYLYRVAHNRWPDLAQDVAQRAIVLVADKIETCANPEAMLTFAALQARRAATEIIRLAQKEVSLDKIAESGVDFEQPAAESARFDQDCLRLLTDTLSRLPERERQVIALKYFERLSDELISQQTGLSVTYVRVSRNRGMRRLREDQQLRDGCL